MNGRRLTVLLLAVLALLAAGCGGDDSNEASSDTDTAIVEQTTSQEATETSRSEATGTEAGGTTLSGECAELAGLGARIAQAISGSNADVEQASKLFDELATKVPDEIKPDFQVIAKNFSKIAEKMKDLNLSAGGKPSTDDLAKLQELSASLSSPEVTAAGQRIQAWAEKNC
jgi:ABC-type Fe3+-hydroxamate transport system substrate-binding protein